MWHVIHNNQSFSNRQTTTSRQATFAHTLDPEVANQSNASGDLALKLRLVNESVITEQ